MNEDTRLVNYDKLFSEDATVENFKIYYSAEPIEKIKSVIKYLYDNFTFVLEKNDFGENLFSLYFSDLYLRNLLCEANGEASIKVIAASMLYNYTGRKFVERENIQQKRLEHIINFIHSSSCKEYSEYVLKNPIDVL